MNKKDCLNFGLLIKKHRIKKNYTQQQLADLVGLSMKSISGIERGVSFPAAVNVFKLAETLDMSLDEFVFGYNRSDSSLNIPEINEMLTKLSRYEQGFILGILRYACESMLENKRDQTKE